jgi:hypothetical protein
MSRRCDWGSKENTSIYQTIMRKELDWGNTTVGCRWVLMQTVILALMTMASVSLAQETALKADQEEDKEMRVSFTAIELSKLPYEKVYYRKGSKFIEIKWRDGRRTIPYPLSKAKAFEIFIDHDDPEHPYLLVGKAPLVSGTSKMLYLLAHNAIKQEGVLPVRIYSIDDSETIFPESSYRFINFSSVPLVVDFNKKRFAVKPGQPKVEKVSLSQGGKFTPFVVRNSKGKVLGGTRLFSHATNREMVLIFPPKKGKDRMDIRYFSE